MVIRRERNPVETEEDALRGQIPGVGVIPSGNPGWLPGVDLSRKAHQAPGLFERGQVTGGNRL